MSLINETNIFSCEKILLNVVFTAKNVFMGALSDKEYHMKLVVIFVTSTFSIYFYILFLPGKLEILNGTEIVDGNQPIIVSEGESLDLTCSFGGWCTLYKLVFNDIQNEMINYNGMNKIHFDKYIINIYSKYICTSNKLFT